MMMVMLGVIVVLCVKYIGNICVYVVRKMLGLQGDMCV